MARRLQLGCADFPHEKYGVCAPEMYVPDEPYVAYRAWNWTSEGITSLEGSLWTPKVAFEATCRHTARHRSLVAACSGAEAEEFFEKHTHLVPDPDCTCGMYAGINMAHLIDIGYIDRGIHGEVHLWGRLYKHTLGWRAQFAYPKYFVVPADMIPLRVDEAMRRLDSLAEFGVEIYLQPQEDAKVGQETIPLWMPDYGYTAQGKGWLADRLIERGAKWYAEHPKEHLHLKVGDRIAVTSSLAQGSGIGIVKEIKNGIAYYTMFSPDKIWSKKVEDICFDERNYRWETKGVGSVRGV